jgi:hypothetical protein
MDVPKAFLKDFEAFPPVLRALLDAELAAGNSVAEFGHGFPAPPAGAYIKLTKHLCSRARQSADGIDFYDRNGSSYSGEITDHKRFFFLLEPPHPPEPEPDMDAIRAAIQARQSGLPSANQSSPAKRTRRKASPAVRSTASEQPCSPIRPKTAVEKFQDSMVIDYEKWHDGIGYDLSLLKTSTPEEQVEIENLLLQRPVSDWRDVEALAALNSPRARVLLRKTFQSRNHELAAAVSQFAPDLISADERSATLVAALEGTDIYTGLTQTLSQVEVFHPAPVIDALLRGVLNRAGSIAVHFAAMLMFLQGKAQSSFDWEQRPYFLRFDTPARADREAMFKDLCGKIGIDPTPYLPSVSETSEE